MPGSAGLELHVANAGDTRVVLVSEGVANLECKVIGVTLPTVSWFKDGVELKQG